MPRTIGGLIGFGVMAVVTVLVGTWLYGNVVSPLVGKVLKKAA